MEKNPQKFATYEFEAPRITFKLDLSCLMMPCKASMRACSFRQINKRGILSLFLEPELAIIFSRTSLMSNNVVSPRASTAGKLVSPWLSQRESFLSCTAMLTSLRTTVKSWTSLFSACTRPGNDCQSSWRLVSTLPTCIATVVTATILAVKDKGSISCTGTCSDS